MALNLPTAAPQQAFAPLPDSGKGAGKGLGAEKAADEGFSFWDFLDVINPLQHIPLVNTLYRAITGDEISSSASIMGGTLYGGPIGFVTSALNVAVKESTGQDVGDHVMTALVGDSWGQPDPTVDVAQAPAQSALAGDAIPQVAQGFYQAPPAPRNTAQADIPLQSLTQTTGVTSPLFTLQRGFSPYAPPVAPPPPTTGEGPMMNPAAQAVPPAALAPTPPLQDGGGALSQGANPRLPGMFKPDPQSIRQALEAQGITTQSSHPMLNLGPTSMPGPGAGSGGFFAPRSSGSMGGPVVPPLANSQAMLELTNGAAVNPQGLAALNKYERANILSKVAVQRQPPAN